MTRDYRCRCLMRSLDIVIDDRRWPASEGGRRPLQGRGGRSMREEKKERSERVGREGASLYLKKAAGRAM